MLDNRIIWRENCIQRPTIFGLSVHLTAIILCFLFKKFNLKFNLPHLFFHLEACVWVDHLGHIGEKGKTVQIKHRLTMLKESDAQTRVDVRCNFSIFLQRKTLTNAVASITSFFSGLKTNNNLICPSGSLLKLLILCLKSSQGSINVLGPCRQCCR